MADRYINAAGLSAIKTWLLSKFAGKDDFDALDAKVDDIISEGGEPNKIDTVKVNGIALVPDAQKAVDVEAAQMSASRNNGELADMNFKQGNLEFGISKYGAVRLKDAVSTEFIDLATQDYVNEHGGKIDKIKVNGTEQTITNKEVDLAVPEIDFDQTTVPSMTINTDTGSALMEVRANDVVIEFDIDSSSYDVTLPTLDYTDASIRAALANGSNPYQTKSDVDTAIGQAVASVYKYKGSVNTLADLEAITTKDEGDVYDVKATGMNYAWNGTNTKWDELGMYVDTSLFWTTEAGKANSLTAMTVAEIMAILEPATP